jgi:hypothetical protein
MTTTHKDRRSASGWKDAKPHTKEERRQVFQNHGEKCFLRPNELKYPVCDRNGRFDCRGIVAAKFWADTAETKAVKKTRKSKRPYSFKKVSRKAKRLGLKLGCAAYSK